MEMNEVESICKRRRGVISGPDTCKVRYALKDLQSRTALTVVRALQALGWVTRDLAPWYRRLPVVAQLLPYRTKYWRVIIPDFPVYPKDLAPVYETWFHYVWAEEEVGRQAIGPALIKALMCHYQNAEMVADFLSGFTRHPQHREYLERLFFKTD